MTEFLIRHFVENYEDVCADSIWSAGECHGHLLQSFFIRTEMVYWIFPAQYFHYGRCI